MLAKHGPIGLAAALALSLGLAAGSPAQAQSLGEVDFDPACRQAAQERFDRALALMHHMMYEQARAAFDQAAEADPDCAMAYWGIATTRFQPLWSTRPSEEELQQGWREIQQARERVDDEREAHLIEATAAFFREPQSADFPTRISRWVAAMEAPYRSHPDDPDVASLYALSRLTQAQRVEDRASLYDEAESILRDVYEGHPQHPGAIHYSIHATDAEGRAENALDMVEAYADIAPEVPHALHMPSHIYVRLGDWPNVIEWNRRSADAALEHLDAEGVSHHYIHALDYLTYAYLQRGEDAKAEAVVDEAQEKERHQGSFISAFHSASMPARLAVERRDWERAAALEPRQPAYLPWDASPWAEGITWYARGLGGVHTGDLKKAQQAEQRLVELRDVAREQKEEAIAGYLEIDRRVLAGRIAQAQGRAEEAVRLTRSAVELEQSVEKHPVTPGALLPPNEALGALLIDLDRPAEALQAYQAADSIWPGRYHTLLGAAQAAEDAGDAQAAREHYERLLATVAEDADRRGVQVAQNQLEQ
jgi:tetratricopeptide (TPR) repeat protein